MRVLIDIPAEDVRRINALARLKHTTPGDIVRAAVLGPATVITLPDRVKARVLAGWTDADIAAEVGESRERIRTIRREWGLKANRRHTPHTTGRSWADGFTDYLTSPEVVGHRRADTFGGYLWGRNESVPPAKALEIAMNRKSA